MSVDNNATLAHSGGSKRQNSRRAGPETAQRRLWVVYLREGRIIAIDAINAPREFIAARRLIAERASLDRMRLADADVPLRAFA